MKLSLLGLLVTLLLVSHGLPDEVERIAEATPETFFGSPENLKLVTTAKSIAVFRVFNSLEKPKGKKSVEIDNHYCKPKPTVVTGAEVKSAVTVLSDTNNFGVEFVCDFDPAIILRFADQKHTLDVLICFHCGEMVIYHDGAVVRRPYKWARSKNTILSAVARHAFAALAKKAFPKDPEIQELKSGASKPKEN